MQARARIAVAGAAGRVGRQVVDVLTEQGHPSVRIARWFGAALAGPTFEERLGVEIS